MMRPADIGKRLILASSSPRRKILLRQTGLPFEAVDSNLVEEHPAGLPPPQLVQSLAVRKATIVARGATDAIVVGADTVVCIDGEILGKPRDAEDACAMLARLSGRTHTVHTGFALIDVPSHHTFVDAEQTAVTFRDLGEDEIGAYVGSGSPMDKAGAYGIQDDYGAVFVTRIEGCFYNVVGFPLARFFMRLGEFCHHIASVSL
jgi:septum formation protein